MSFHATTILAVRKNGKLAIAGDGQVTLGHTVFKSTARKIRKIEDKGILAGFAGTAGMQTPQRARRQTSAAR